MPYLVMGSDGKEYGPVDVPTLQEWVRQNRISQQTMVREFESGTSMLASAIPGLFPGQTITAPAGPGGVPPGNWSQPPAYYPRPMTQSGYSSGSGNAVIWHSVIRAILAIVFFFVFKGIGVFFAAYGVIYAFRAQSSGHKYGPIAIAISLVALGLVILGWVLRLNGAGV